MSESIWHAESVMCANGERGIRLVFRNGDVVTYNHATGTLTVDRAEADVSQPTLPGVAMRRYEYTDGGPIHVPRSQSERHAMSSITVTIQGHGTYSASGHAVDVMIARHLPSSPALLRAVVVEATDDPESWNDRYSVSELLVVLANFYEAEITNRG
jgi:hypothetical protein